MFKETKSFFKFQNGMLSLVKQKPLEITENDNL